MKRVRMLDGVEVGLEWRDGKQVIVAKWAAGETSGMTRLLDVLADDAAVGRRYEEPGLVIAEVVHTNAVDRRIMDLVDLLIDIRVLHPTMVQLKLVLNDEEERKELQAVLSG